jgi:hypothetical protein
MPLSSAKAQPPKRLPGFLRRSLRQNSYNANDVEEDVEEIEIEKQHAVFSEEDISQDHSTVSKALQEEEEEDDDDEEEDITQQVNSKFRLSLSMSDAAPRNKKAAVMMNNARQQQNIIKAEQTTSTTSINNSSQEENNNTRKLNYKESEFKKVIEAQVVDMSELRRLSWNGIPPEYRAKTWQILLGYLPTNSARRKTTLKRKRAEYLDAMAQHYDIDDNTRTNSEQDTLRQVLVDVPRTAPDTPLFHNDRIRTALARLLYIWAIRHPASSYVQGINDLATPLLAVFLSGYYGGKDVLNGHIMDDLPDTTLTEVEADVYWCLTNLLAGIQDHYTTDQPGVQRMVMKLEELINRIDKGLAEHFSSMGIVFMQFAFKWMNCLLLREFSLKCVLRLWDTYLSEKDGGFETFHVYVCAAFLCQFSQDLQQMEFDELFGFMQNIPTSDWGDGEIEILLSQAFVLSTLFHGSDAHLANQT